MTPKWRDQWLLPLLVRTFNKSVLAILNFIRSIHELYKVYVKDSNSKRDYDADGLHRGAITTQAIFNQKQAHVESVRVQTLSHQHVADIQNLNSNAKGSLVSCGQDGRLVLWDAEKALGIQLTVSDREEDTSPSWYQKAQTLNQFVSRWIRVIDGSQLGLTIILFVFGILQKEN